MADVKVRIIGEDLASDEIAKVDEELGQLGGGADEMGDKLDGASMRFTEMVSIMQLVRTAGEAISMVFKVASEGAEEMGGDIADAYSEWNENMQEAEANAKGLLARGLLPMIEADNERVEIIEKANVALEQGIITQQEYNSVMALAHTTGISYNNVADETAEKLDQVDISARGAAEGVRELTKAELAHIQFQQSSWDRAMLVSAGLIESKVNPALLEMQEDARAAQTAWGMLAQQIAGPFGKSAETFAEKNAALVQHIADIKEEIADLGGLQYMTPEQQDNILTLRDELIGVSMEIHAIDEEFGEAFDAGKQGRRVLAAADTLEDLRQAAWELEQQIISLGSKPYTTAANLEKINDLQTELGETEQAIKDLQAAQEEQTRVMVLNMLQQTLALDGLTLAEVQRLNDIALAMGLIDQATYDAQQTVLEAADLINNDADLNELLEKLNEIEGVHYVNIVFTVTGQELLDAAADDLAAMQDAHQGGYVDPTNPYGPGNSGASGGVDPTEPGGYQGGGDAPGGNMPSGGGDVPNLNINIDGQTVARITADQLGALARQSRSAGGGWTGR